MGLIKAIPTITHVTSWMVPAIKSMAHMDVPNDLYQDDLYPRCVSQDIILSLVDAPTKRGKNITEHYVAREAELIAAVQAECGPEWWITKTTHPDVSEIECVKVRVCPSRTTLLYHMEERNVYLPGTSCRSGNQINFHFYAFKFETPEFAAAFKIVAD